MFLTTYAFDFQWPADQNFNDEVCAPRLRGRRHFKDPTPVAKEKKDEEEDAAVPEVKESEDLNKEDVKSILDRIEWTSTSLMGRLVAPQLIPAKLSESQQRLLDKLTEDKEFNYVPPVPVEQVESTAEMGEVLGQMERIARLERMKVGQAEKITTMNKSAIAAARANKDIKLASEEKQAARKQEDKKKDEENKEDGKKEQDKKAKTKTREEKPSKPKKYKRQNYPYYDSYKEGPQHKTWQDFKCFCF